MSATEEDIGDGKKRAREREKEVRDGAGGENEDIFCLEGSAGRSTPARAILSNHTFISQGLKLLLSVVCSVGWMVLSRPSSLVSQIIFRV